jgi:uncharacterized protein (DUF2147 family)
MDSRRTQYAGLGLLVLLWVAALSPRAAVADDAAVFGYWKHFDDDTGKPQSYFRLWEDKGKLIGKIVKVLPTAKKPAQSVCSECSGAQKDKPVKGLIFMWGFVRDDSNPKKWVEGKVLNPEDGKVYNAEVELSEDGKTLSVYGYIRVIVKLGGTSNWKRATPDEIAGLQQQ